MKNRMNSSISSNNPGENTVSTNTYANVINKDYLSSIIADTTKLFSQALRIVLYCPINIRSLAYNTA